MPTFTLFRGTGFGCTRAGSIPLSKFLENDTHFDGAHFATFPPELIRPCILAGAPPAGVVLDPFMGSGTTALTALEEGRRFIGIELNPKYVQLSTARINNALQQGIQTKLEI